MTLSNYPNVYAPPQRGLGSREGQRVKRLSGVIKRKNWNHAASCHIYRGPLKNGVIKWRGGRLTAAGQHMILGCRETEGCQAEGRFRGHDLWRLRLQTSQEVHLQKLRPHWGNRLGQENKQMWPLSLRTGFSSPGYLMLFLIWFYVGSLQVLLSNFVDSLKY